MSNLNLANRECANLTILDLETKQPFLEADFCNTTTFGLTSDITYASKKGSKAIAFSNPIEGSMKIDFQVAPFKVYALLSDGKIKTDAVKAVKIAVTADSVSSLTIDEDKFIKDSVFVYAKDDDCGTPLTVTVSGNTITGTFVSGETYIVRGLQKISSGVSRIEFNNKALPKDYYITMETVDKADNGDLVPKVITAYKATPKRTFEMALTSSGDACTVTMEFTCLEDNDGNVIDMAIIED